MYFPLKQRTTTIIAGLSFAAVEFILLAGLMAVGLSPILALVPVVGLIMMIVSLRRPFILVVMIAFFIPLEPFTTIQGASVNRYLSLLLLVVWLFEHVTKRKPFHLERPVLLMVIWVVYSHLSYFWGPATEDFFRYFFGFLLALILMAITADQVNTRRKLAWTLNAFLLGIMVYIIIWFIFGQVDYKGFFLPTIGTGVLSSHGTALGWSIACIIPVVLYAPTTKYRLLAVLTLIPAGYLLFATGLRRNLLAIPLVMLALLTLQKHFSWRTIIITGLLFLMTWYGGNSILSLLPNRVQARFTLNALIESGGTGRRELIEVAIDLFKTSPFAGAGLGSFRSFAGTTIGKTTFPHNAYLEVLSQTGLIGFALWGGAVLLVATALVKTYQACKNDADRLLISIPLALLMFLLVNGTVDSYENYRPFWFALGLGIASAKAMYNDRNGKRIAIYEFPDK